MDNSDVKIDIPHKDVYITEKDGDLPKLIPTDEDGSLALDTVAVSFPGVIGLGYKSSETGLFRQLSMNPDETFSEPVGGWENKTFIAICKKNETVLKIEFDELKEDFIEFKSDFNSRLEFEIKASERRIKNDILKAVQIFVLALQAVLVIWNIILFFS
uniref:TAR DNA-binding protein 43 N-terminal domain-containing protein n=1 Tax=Meloidogyne incognita TaxID=6306 RepID=A0A914KWU5_MELIC